MRNPRQREADLRAQLAAGPRRRRAGGGARRALRPRHAARRAARDARTTRSAAPAPGSPSSRTGRARRATCSRPPTATSSCGCAPPCPATSSSSTSRGSAAQHDGNLNCPLAVTVSACYFALRVLTDPDVPPCAGAYRPLTVVAPEGSLLNARPPAAVAAGNVETSSRVADLVLAAFGRACGQGTMNNLTLGQRRLHLLRDARRRPGRLPGRRRPERRARGHVEHAQHARSRRSSSSSRCGRSSTRCGGAPAARPAAHGGDGVVRELEALDEMRYSLITERRRHPPPGARRAAARAPRVGIC